MTSLHWSEKEHFSVLLVKKINSVLQVTLTHISALESCPSKWVTSLNSFIGRLVGIGGGGYGHESSEMDEV